LAIANGHQFKIDALTLRNAQHFGEDFLIRRWREIEKDRRKNDRVARETAMNALRRRPLQIAGLALRTYMGYGASHPFSHTPGRISAVAS